MNEETGFPEPGDTLTIAGEIITIGGQIMHEKGDKVIVEKVDVREGHWYRPIPDIWIKAELGSIGLVGYDHISYLPHTFEETKRFIKS